jgi:membrane protein YdbS with pleckstrin-like domain
VSTPTAAPPSWLEAAAKLDALLGDKVPVRSEPEASATDDVDRRPGPEARATGDSEPSLTLPARTEPRPRITPPIIPASENGEEVDVAWRGWSPLAVVPSTLGLAALTALTLWVVRPLIPARVGPVAVEGPLAAAWLLQLVRGAYRLMAYNYRLTTRRLFRERGRLYRPEPPIDLATVIAVETAQNRLERWLGIGTVLVVPEDATPQVPGIEFIGVRRPKALADLIDAAAKAAHEGNVAAARIPGEADVRS